MGLGYAPLRNKATQMGIEHLMDILNKPIDTSYLAYAHTSRASRKHIYTNIGQMKPTKLIKLNSQHYGSYQTSRPYQGQSWNTYPTYKP